MAYLNDFRTTEGEGQLPSSPSSPSSIPPYHNYYYQQQSRWLQQQLTSNDGFELEPSPDIPPERMAIAVIPILLVAILGIILKLGNVRTLLVASTRCVIQLLLLGLILSPIFVSNEPYVVLPYLLFMVIFATREASVKPKHQYDGMRLHMLIAIVISLTFFLALISFGVLQPNPFYDAQVIIPVGGMMLGSCVTSLSLGMDRFLLSLSSGSTTQGSATLQTYLACGATRWEASLPSIRQALETGLTPNLNQMSVMGLVSIPGMFTGQILAGTPPWIAAKYQIVIMFFICSNSIFMLFFTIVQAIFLQLFHRKPNQQYYFFRGDLVSQRSGGKPKDIALATMSSMVSCVDYFTAKLCSKKSTMQKKKNDDIKTSVDDLVVVGASSHTDDNDKYSSTISSCIPTQKLKNTVSDDAAADGPKIDDGHGEVLMVPLNIAEDTATSLTIPPVVNTVVRIWKGSTFATSREQNEPVITLRDGKISLGGRVLLDKIHLELYEEEIMVISGASGTGKSTLLRALALLQPFDEAVLSFKGSPIASNGGANVWRSEVLYVRQGGGQGLMGTPKDVLNKLCELDVQSRRLPKDKKLVLDRFASNLEALSLSTNMMDHPWDNMSGGEAQRVYMCMLLALQPTVILLDEPTSACDELNAKKVENLIVSNAVAVIWISHDPAQMERLRSLEQTSLLQVAPIVESAGDTPAAGVGDGSVPDIEG
jgi:putative ABC transport system permease protein